MYTTGELLEMRAKEIEELRKDLEAANEAIEQRDRAIEGWMINCSKKQDEIYRLRTIISDAYGKARLDEEL